MGILGLSRLIADCAPLAIKEQDVGSYFGRKIAIDASMAIYQFLIAIRSSNNMMTNESGETTSHLVGLFYRTCKMLESGVKPIYVFDGKAPELKSGELDKRKERRKEAEKHLAQAKTDEEVQKFSKRLIRVTRQHNEDCKKLLTLLGCPIVCAPSEAEAQCAQLCKEGLVYGIATEDMDGLTFGTPRLIRNLSSGRADDKAREYNFEKVLQSLELTHDQFIDLSILMGCDYCPSIKGIGGKKGLDLIKKYGSIEEILREKYNVHEFLDVQLTYTDKETKEIPVNLDEVDKESADVKMEQDFNEIKQENMSPKQIEMETEMEEKKEVSEEEEEEISFSKKKSNKNFVEDDEENADEEEFQVKKEEKSDDEYEQENKKSKKSKGKKSNKDFDPVPENWLFRGARQLFKNPDVIKNSLTEADLRFKDVDEEGLIHFLCVENGFSEERIRPAIGRVRAAKKKGNQSRIDSFFQTLPSSQQNLKTPSSNKKRPATGKGSESKRGRRPR